MKHKLVFLFSYHQYWLQRVILLCSFHRVFHGCMALDGTWYLQKLETFTDGTLPPSLPVTTARPFLHQHIAERSCASELGVLTPSLIMMHCVALNGHLTSLIKWRQQLRPQGPIVRNKGHTYGKMYCKLQRAIEILTNFNIT